MADWKNPFFFVSSNANRFIKTLPRDWFFGSPILPHAFYWTVRFIGTDTFARAIAKHSPFCLFFSLARISAWCNRHPRLLYYHSTLTSGA